ncbi:uncharacterized protein LOC129762049 [Toxorhynchites rutilus septentrionalis]|uniref:uncharacterized protein LOC129762049 n=1 Tax=Toxorhynchites rutilus septentrionalis TaxID=329112 RepID=UPI0024798CF2|nr:uncharacterized protein LOC129762049 [Toxorhynchites rutilus septentrionalis]
MWPQKKSKYVNLETLTEAPRRIRFNLFHRPKDIVSDIDATRRTDISQFNDSDTRKRSCLKNRPTVNLFPQISLNDLRDKELKNILDYMYSSDWKEASTFTATASCANLTQIQELRKEDITVQFPERFRKKSSMHQRIDLPVSDIDLQKWYTQR